MSKLALLAKQRAAARAAEAKVVSGEELLSEAPINKPVAILDRLGLQSDGAPQPQSKMTELLKKRRLEREANERGRNQGLAGLTGLTDLKKGDSKRYQTVPKVHPKVDDTKLDLKDMKVDHKADEIELKLDRSHNAGDQTGLTPTGSLETSNPSLSQLNYNVPRDNSLMQLPTSDVAVTFFKRNNEDCHEENRSKRRRHNSDIFYPLTNIELNVEKITKAKENFSSPSPDDTVLEAQKNAFEGMGNLKISQKPAKKAAQKTKPKKKLDIEQELKTNAAYSKPHRSFVVMGHVDAGKSTLMGRILFDFGIVDAKTVNKLVKEAEKAGKGSFALAWIMDQTAEERQHGVTVDICATDFETSTTRFTAIDSPGHKDFVPQMIGGVSQADFAVLVVDSISGEFESGFAMDGQTKEHTILARNLGIENLCVAVNKMDKENWSESRFDAIKEQLQEYLTSSDVGFSKEKITFIPISGLNGNMVVKRDPSVNAVDWYKGPTLGEYLENVEVSVDKKGVAEETFVLSVHDSFKDKGEIKVTGKINSGVIQVGETIESLPSEVSLAVHSILVSGKNVDFAIKGELVQLCFKANQVENENVEPFRVGDLVTTPESPIRCAKKLVVSLQLFDMKKPLLVGSPIVLFRGNSHVPARLSAIIEVKSDTKKKKKILHLTSKKKAVVEIDLGGEVLPLTKYSENKALGRVVLRREGVTIGAGTVEETI